MPIHQQLQQQQQPGWQYKQGPNGSYYAVIAPGVDGRQTQQPQRASVANYNSHVAQNSRHASTSRHSNNINGKGSSPHQEAPTHMQAQRSQQAYNTSGRIMMSSNNSVSDKCWFGMQYYLA
jgi:hypothetical protein